VRKASLEKEKQNEIAGRKSSKSGTASDTSSKFEYVEDFEGRKALRSQILVNNLKTVYKPKFKPTSS